MANVIRTIVGRLTARVTTVRLGVGLVAALVLMSLSWSSAYAQAGDGAAQEPGGAGAMLGIFLSLLGLGLLTLILVGFVLWATETRIPFLPRQDATGIARYFTFNTDHKVIGIQYFWTTFAFFFLGGLMALLVRWELRLQVQGEPSSLLQINDGRFLWIDRQKFGEHTVGRIDVRQVRALLQEVAGRPPERMMVGGLSDLLAGIEAHYAFGPASTGTLSDVPISNLRQSDDGAGGALRASIGGGRSTSTSLSARMKARWMQFFSSRTLPGQE